MEFWFKNGKLHREQSGEGSGPAITYWYNDGEKWHESWYNNGQLMREEWYTKCLIYRREDFLDLISALF